MFLPSLVPQAPCRFLALAGRWARSGACVSVDARAPFAGSAVLELADWDSSDLIAG